MEHYDSQMAARVWQRVQNISAAPELSGVLLPLLKEETEDTALYRQLSNTQSKETAAIAAKLTQLSQSCVHILRGIYTLAAGTSPEVLPAQFKQTASPLRHCYGRSLHRSLQYSQQRNHTDYGCAFAHLEELAKQRCVLLLQWIGNTKGHKPQ